MTSNKRTFSTALSQCWASWWTTLIPGSKTLSFFISSNVSNKGNSSFTASKSNKSSLTISLFKVLSSKPNRNNKWQSNQWNQHFKTLYLKMPKWPNLWRRTFSKQKWKSNSKLYWHRKPWSKLGNKKLSNMSKIMLIMQSLRKCCSKGTWKYLTKWI